MTSCSRKDFPLKSVPRHRQSPRFRQWGRGDRPASGIFSAGLGCPGLRAVDCHRAAAVRGASAGGGGRTVWRGCAGSVQSDGWEPRIALSLARPRMTQRRDGEAKQILAPVYERFTDGYETTDLRAARIMFETLPTGYRPRTDPADRDICDRVCQDVRLGDPAGDVDTASHRGVEQSETGSMVSGRVCQCPGWDRVRARYGCVPEKLNFEESRGWESWIRIELCAWRRSPNFCACFRKSGIGGSPPDVAMPRVLGNRSAGIPPTNPIAVSARTGAAHWPSHMGIPIDGEWPSKPIHDIIIAIGGFR